jgi:drug/metabolite transporter (DMT)-like permease
LGAIWNEDEMDKTTSGWISGFIGVVIFSGSLPATRLAVMQFDPVFLTVARAAIAGILALALLLVFQQKRPQKSDLVSLAIVAGGVVLGFPLLTALALQHVTSAHSIVFIGLLPLATAIFGVLRGGERPKPAFWMFSLLGSAAVAGFALAQGLAASPQGDLLMLAAVIVCGLGYAEGAKLSRTIGGWQVISWALVLSLAGHAGRVDRLPAGEFFGHRSAGLDRPRLCVALQHADRLRVLVSRTGAGRDRGRRPVAAAAAILRAGPGRLAAA